MSVAKQAQGTQEARIRRNKNRRCAQQLCQWPGVQRSGAAKGHQGKALRIVSPLHRDDAQGPPMLLLTICTMPAAAS